ncbi:MAG: TVP38/TMEM64 family protein [Acidimicrobiia bacterium]
MLVVGDDIGGWWAGLSETLANPEAFRAWVEGLGAWGPIGYLLTQAAQVVVVPIPGTLFPPVGALALSLAGMALGSAVVFLVARRWGRPLAIRLAGAERVQRYQTLMTARGGVLIWLVFLLPFLPDDAVCALAGLSGIGFGRFMLIATVGRIPAVAAGVFTMAGLEGAPAWVWGIAAAGFVLVLWAGAQFGPTIEGRLVGLNRAPRPDPEETGRMSRPSSVPPVTGSGHRPPGRSRAPHPDVS